MGRDRDVSQHHIGFPMLQKSSSLAFENCSSASLPKRDCDEGRGAYSAQQMANICWASLACMVNHVQPYLHQSPNPE